MKSYNVTVENNGMELEHYTIDASKLDEAVKLAEKKYNDAPVVEIDGQEISGKIKISVSGEDGTSESEFDA